MLQRGFSTRGPARLGGLRTSRRQTRRLLCLLLQSNIVFLLNCPTPEEPATGGVGQTPRMYKTALPQSLTSQRRGIRTTQSQGNSGQVPPEDTRQQLGGEFGLHPTEKFQPPHSGSYAFQRGSAVSHLPTPLEVCGPAQGARTCSEQEKSGHERDQVLTSPAMPCVQRGDRRVGVPVEPLLDQRPPV